MINDSQARQILLGFGDTNPAHLQGIQATAKALSLYGYPNGDATAYVDHNWLAVPAGMVGGDCEPGGVRFPLVGSGYICTRTFASAQEGIAAAMKTLWFPLDANGLSPDAGAFAIALEQGDTNKVAQMVTQRAWGIPRRNVTMLQLGDKAASTVATDIYLAAQEIAKNLGEPLYLQAPSTTVTTLAPLGLALSLLSNVPPLPSLPALPGLTPGGGNLPAGAGPAAPAKPSGFFDTTFGKGLLVLGGALGLKAAYDKWGK